jgi:uncharacterized protein YpmB
MILSRSEKERRLPSLSRIRWLILITGFVVFVAVSFFLYIRSADSHHRNAMNNAIEIAHKQGGLKDVSEAVIHTWDETVWVVTGMDSEGETWMLWERKTELVKRKVSENMSKKRMLTKFSEEHVGLEPIRVLPGWFNDQPVWEIRYWNETAKEHQSIDFYSFQDGTKLKTYALSSQ